jgi:hypothetical protein
MADLADAFIKESIMPKHLLMIRGVKLTALGEN